MTYISILFFVIVLTFIFIIFTISTIRGNDFTDFLILSLIYLLLKASKKKKVLLRRTQQGNGFGNASLFGMEEIYLLISVRARRNVDCGGSFKVGLATLPVLSFVELNSRTPSLTKLKGNGNCKSLY